MSARSGEIDDESYYGNVEPRTMKKTATTSGEIEDEPYYGNVEPRTVKKTGTTSDQKFPSFAKFLPPLAVCWVTLLIIMSFCIYFTFVMTENNAGLQHLKELQEIKIANVTKENQNLKTQNEQLETQNKQRETQNQELERQKKDLTEKILDIETKPNEINISRAQWSIDAYCSRKNNRQCKPCQEGWEVSQSSCYAINNAQPADRKTWDEAREDCKAKTSDLAFINNPDEKKFINDNSWGSSGTNGFWIGLRVEDGKWKWVNGTDLTQTSWMQHPPTDGHCAISVKNQGWKSVNCTDTKMWICEKAALYV